MEDGLAENWPSSDTFFSLLVIILGPIFCSFSPFYRNKKISGQFLTDFFKEINSLLPLASNFILQQIWQFWFCIFSTTSLLQTWTTSMFKTSYELLQKYSLAFLMLWISMATAELLYQAADKCRSSVFVF